MRAHEFIFEEDASNLELIKWFGKSKIVDENGNPKVVYHGTSADFEIFQKPEMNRMADRSAVGFWFTSSKEDAQSYGKNLKQVLLKMVKPRRITRRKLDELAVSYPLSEVMAKLKAGGCDGLIIEAIKPDPIMEEKGMPEQYVVFNADQIRMVGNSINESVTDPEFNNWFGNSIAVDKKGKPLVFYHGTTAKFDTFSKGDIGFHVGTKSQARSRVGRGKNSIVMPLNIKITNPLKINEDFGSWQADRDTFEKLHNMHAITDQQYQTWAEKKNGMYGDYYKGYDSRASTYLRNALMQNGYDSIIYTNRLEDDKMNTSVILFQPSQIRMVKENITESILHEESEQWTRSKEKGLDMSFNARMQRAKEMGFDINTKYYHGTTRDFERFHPNKALAGLIFVSPDPQEANNFTSAHGGNVVPVFINKGRTLPGIHIASNEVELAEKAKKKGYDSLRVRDSHLDMPNIALFDPSRIRSIHAAFDPDYKDSSDILS